MKVFSFSLLFVSSSTAFAPARFAGEKRTSSLSVSASNYLSSLGTDEIESTTTIPVVTSTTAKLSTPTLNLQFQISAPSSPKEQDGTIFTHATRSYFDVDKLTPKGPRKNADVGHPHDSSRKLVTIGENTSAGSWWCAKGGWPSPTPRATTEVFYVFEGHACVTDTDGVSHYFGPGDLVILPKGWSGRWDVLQDIHKVWVVHDHPDTEEQQRSNTKAVIEHYHGSGPQYLQQAPSRTNASHGTPQSASRTVYDAGPTTEVGYWTCTPGSFPVSERSTTEFFHVLEGVFFLTNAVDGTARRCIPGDTVVLPKGWSGYWDIIEPVKKLWVTVE